MDVTEPRIRREEILFLQDPDFNRENVCIVTDAGGGIGRATAIVAAANNITTVGLDVNEKEGEITRQMATEMGGRMIFIRTDLTLDGDIERAVNEASKAGTIKYLANIAGIQQIDTRDNSPMELYDLTHRIMLRAPFFLSKLTIPYMKTSKNGTGVIGNMSCVHGNISTVNKPAYNITKFGLKALTQSIAAEGAGKIRSFSVNTGFVKTEFALNQISAQARQSDMTPEEVVRNVIMGTSRVKELMAPVEVANLFLFGFSRFASYLVGGEMLFDGGMVLTY